MSYPFQLPELGFDYDALEPHIDARTMEIHHQKHHGAYTANFNKALEGYSQFHSVDAEHILRGFNGLPSEIQTPDSSVAMGQRSGRLECRREPRHGTLADVKCLLGLPRLHEGFHQRHLQSQEVPIGSRQQSQFGQLPRVNLRFAAG